MSDGSQDRLYTRDEMMRLQRRIADLEAVQIAAIKMLDDLDNATGPDEWSTSELRAAIDAAGEKDNTNA